MAAFLLLGLTTYLRPSQLMSLQRRHLIKPALGITRHWCVLANAVETNTYSKIGDQDVSIALDSLHLQWANPLWKSLSEGNAESPVFGFTYPQYYQVFKKAVTRLEKPSTVPYQVRHSGPSADFASGDRGLVEIKKRGQWLSDKSVRRYEKSGRLAFGQRFERAEISAYLHMAEKKLPEVLLFGKPTPPLPPLRGR